MRFALGSIAIWIGVVDSRERRIPNAAILFGIAVVVAGMAVPKSIPATSFQDAALGAVLSLALGVVGYATRSFGAGDVKYAALVGACCGFGNAQLLWLSSGLFLGGMAIAVLSANRILGTGIRSLPVGVAISAGFLLTLCLKFTAA